MEVGRIDSHHLPHGSLRCDRRQMDEGTDTPPCKPGDTLDQFLVLVDAIVSSRLRLVEAGQQEGGGKPGDGLSGACCHGNVSEEDVNASAALPFEPERSPSCQYIRGQRRGPFQSSNGRHGRRFDAMHFTVENLVMNGGSLTPRKPTRPNQRLSYMRFNRTLNKAPTQFYLQQGINPSPFLRLGKLLEERSVRLTGKIHMTVEFIHPNIFSGPRNNFVTPIIRLPNTLYW